MPYLLGVVLLVLCGMVQAEEFNAKVIAVLDGDTVLLLHEGKKIKARLVNIDAPELRQEYGKESRQSLADRVLKKEVHVNSKAIDSYGRMIADISVDGKSVSEALVSDGMAWEYSHFHRNKHYLALSKQARQAKRGLWAQVAPPVAPQQWRKLHPSKNHATTDLAPAGLNTACGKKHLCREMISCEEAKIYLIQCRVQTLDGNGDGVPCESLCLAEKYLKQPVRQGASLVP
jgi:endonuclease YncB( thermonuclease family)